MTCAFSQTYPDNVKVTAVRAWNDPVRKKIHIELDASVDSDYFYSETVLKASLYLNYNVNSKPLVSKRFKIKQSLSSYTNSFELPMPDAQSEWTLQAPILYTIRYEIYGIEETEKKSLLVFDQDFGWSSDTLSLENVKAVYEDGCYAGYNVLPISEIDFRTRNIRNSGYLLIRDQKESAHARYARNCARLGMLYEPRFSDFNASNTAELKSYLEALDLWVKQRAFSPAIIHWLLPEMPDSVAALCKQRIARIDKRPVLLETDASLIPAAPALGEPSLAEAPLLNDTVTEITEASILKGAPGINYFYRVNCGGGETIDSNGQRWMADMMSTNLAGKSPNAIKANVAGKLLRLPEADQPVLQSYRICNTSDSMSYYIKVDSLSSYCVEFYLQEPILARGGGRVFTICINDKESDLIDIRQLAGTRCAVVKLAFSVYSGNKDYLDIRFPKPYAGHAIVSAIAVGTLIPEQMESNLLKKE